MLLAALYTIAKTWKKPKSLSMNEWTKTMCINTMEYYSAFKKNKNLSNMVGPEDMLSEIS